MDIFLWVVFLGFLLYGLLTSFLLWTDSFREIQIFNRTIKVHRLLRIERELLGEHRKPFSVFSASSCVGLLAVFIGALLKSAFVLKLSFIFTGLSFFLYGLYGLGKKEIFSAVPVGYWGRVYGVGAVLSAIFFYILIGSGLIVVGIFATFF